MKTFTLRLQDSEAEALERLAFVHGVSKNKILIALISNSYFAIPTEIISTVEAVDPEMLTSAESWPREIERLLEEIGGRPDKGDIKRLIKCYDYALEKGNIDGETENELREKRKKWLEQLRRAKMEGAQDD